MTKEEAITKVYGGGAHVVILGAGASIACTLRNGEKNGMKLPSMNGLIEAIELNDLIKEFEIGFDDKNFEVVYSFIVEKFPNSPVLKELESRIRDYFSKIVISDDPTIYDYLVLGLRKKDIISTFNWDPLLWQAIERNWEFLEGKFAQTGNSGQTDPLIPF